MRENGKSYSRGRNNGQKISIPTMWISIILLVGVVVLSTIMYQCSRNSCSFEGHPTKKAYVFAANMRTLWEDHLVWTRNYIISDIAGLGDKADVLARLLKNQDDIGSAIVPLYGDEAGAKLAALLKQHILIAVEVVIAAKANDSKAFEVSSKKWYANADDIALFLSSAISTTSKETQKVANDSLKDMLYKHLEYTTGEVVSRLKQDWKADIEFCDKGHQHMLMFSDFLVGAMYKQFLKNFK
jgi:hypothetical protein